MIDIPQGHEIRIDDGTEPVAHSTPKLDLYRVEPGKPLVGIVLDTHPLKVFTHWWGGRTVPCLWNDCKPCGQHRKPEWHGYFTVYSPRTCTVAVVEATTACRDTMARWEQMHGRWRGAQLTLIRVGKERNSRLKMMVSSGNIPVETLPQPIDLMDYMIRLWGAAMHVQDLPRDGNSAYNASLSRASQDAVDQGLIRQHP